MARIAVFFILTTVLFSVWVGVVSAATVPVTHRVTGKVVAVNTQDGAPTVVVSARAGAEEMVVGATIGEKTTIRRGGKRIAIGQLRVGETVHMAYQKTNTGLVAVSVAAR